MFKLAIALLALLMTTAAHASDSKLIHILSVPVCPTPQMRELECRRLSSGKVEIISEARDSLSRKIFQVRVDGIDGYMSEYYFDKYLVPEDPVVKASRDKAKAVAAKADYAKRGGASIGMSADQVRASCWASRRDPMKHWR